MKGNLMMKRTLAVALSVIIVAMMLPLSVLSVFAGGSETPVKTYTSLYDTLNATAASATHNAISSVDYTNTGWEFSGSIWGNSWASTDSSLPTYRWNSDVQVLGVSGISLNNYGIKTNSDPNYYQAIGIRHSESFGNCFVALSFIAPDDGVYRVVPRGFNAAGGRSMLLSKGNGSGVVADCNQTMKISHGTEILAEKTLALAEGFAPVADDFPTVSCTMSKGEALTFTFNTTAAWEETDLYVGFDIQLMEYTSTAVEGVAFKKSNYIVKKGDALNIAADVLPASAANKKVAYTVEDPSVLTVSENGDVTALAPGYTTVTVTTEEGAYTDTATVCVYDDTASVYDILGHYSDLVAALGTTGADTPLDYNIQNPWKGVYENGGAYTVFEKFYKESWGNNTIGIYSSLTDTANSGNTSKITHYKDGQNTITEVNYGRQDRNPNGVGLKFVAPEKGIYSFTSDDNIALGASTVSYMAGYADAQGSSFEVNFYLNSQKLHGVSLSYTTQSVDFPVLNCIEMQQGDEFFIEFVTDCWEKGKVNISPKAVRVFEALPTKAVTSVDVTDSVITLEKNASRAIIATVLPDNASDKSLSYHSSNEAVATVNASGTVTAVASGTAVITVKSVSNPEVYDTVTVKVPYDSAKAVDTLHNDALSVGTEEGVNTAMTYGSAFAAGVLKGGVYNDFTRVIRQTWSNPRAAVLTNDAETDGNTVIYQYLSMYDGMADINSYIDNEWVYFGFRAPQNGIYSIDGADNYQNIVLSTGRFSADELISWGEDKPSYVRITVNGEKIWPAESDGYELKPSGTLSVEFPNLSDIKLYKGDVIRVEVSGQSGVNRHTKVLLDFDVTMQEPVTVQTPVTEVVISDLRCELKEGESYRVTANGIPTEAENKNVRFESEDPSVATVNSSGVITGVSAGTTKIWAISEDNENARSSCDVTVRMSYPAENAVDILWQEGLAAVTSESTNTEFIPQQGYVGGVLKGGRYTDFTRGVRLSWGNPDRAFLVTNDVNANGNNVVYQSFSLCNHDGKNLANIGSYVDNEWVYFGFVADENGLYDIFGAEQCPDITLYHSTALQDLINWGEDRPSNVRITVNGERIWPVNADYFELKPSATTSVAFPTLDDILLYKGDVLRVEVSGQAGVNRHTSVMFNFETELQEIVTIQKPVESISLSANSCEIKAGKTVELSATVVPEDAENHNIRFVSENPAVATVSPSGVITGVSAGTTKIWAISADNENVKSACDVTVNYVYPAENAVTPLWNEALGAISSENVNTAFTPTGKFHAGVLQGGYYNDFSRAVKQKWGAPNRAVMLTNDAETDGQTAVYQYVSLYNHQGADIANVGSYVDNEWVYLGYRATEDGIYNIEPSALRETIDLSISGGSVDDLINWGEDKPTYVRITKNGQQIWPASGQGYMFLPSGSHSTLFPTIENVTLYKGDVIRVEVSGQSGVNRHTTLVFDYNVVMQKPVAVTVPVTGMSLSAVNCEVSVGRTCTVAANLLPANAQNKNVVFSSENTAVATVNSAGVVTGVAEGTTKIWVTSIDNPNVKAACTVTVTRELPVRNLFTDLHKNGSAVAVTEGVNVRFSYTGAFIAGTLDTDGVYNNFGYAVRQNWGTPRAIMLTNDASTNGQTAVKQYTSIYDKRASVGSYLDDEWVFLGFKAPENGKYTIMGADVQKNIELVLGKDLTPEILKDWGEDKPTYIRITRNGQQIWPSSGGAYKLQPSGELSVPFPTIENINLYKGDCIRVEVSGQAGVNRHTSVVFCFDVRMDDTLAVVNPVSGVTLNTHKLELPIDGEAKLGATVLPANADNKNVRFVSSNPEVAIVDSVGKVTGIGSGTAVIYAISEESDSILDTCEVTVLDFKIINYTPDELKADMDSQLDGAEIVLSKEIEINSNWSAHYSIDDGKNWVALKGLTTTVYESNKAGDLSAYTFRKTSKDAVGLEKLSGGYYQPLMSTEDAAMALTFTATRAGTYTISPDIRNNKIYVPGTYTGGRIPKEDMDKEYKFAILLGDKEIYSAMLSGNKSSVTFPEIENIYMDANDTLRFVLFDCASEASQMALYFSPVVSLVTPDKTPRAPIVESRQYILDPNTTFSGRIKAVHPNGLPIKYEILTAGQGTLTIAADGKITYAPLKDYKGLDKFTIKCSDERGLSATATLTFMVTVKYDAVTELTALSLKADPKMTGTLVPLTFPEYGWKYQYTYDGFTYANGSPQYMNVNSVEVISNPGWWGYTMYSTGMPQLTVTEFDGAATVGPMAGNTLWGLNPVGGTAFYAPHDATYMLTCSDMFQKFKVGYPDDEKFQKTIKVWISKNGQKIWPAEEDYILLSKDLTEYDFPTLMVAMKKGDNVRICISGDPENERTNRVYMVPVVYDLGAYDANLDPYNEPEAGLVITDDDGEPTVNYMAFKSKVDKISILKDSLEQPVTEGTKNKITGIKQTDKFSAEISFRSAKEAAAYRVTVFKLVEDGYELISDETVEELKASVFGLEEGKYAVQVIALDRYGQPLEIYTAREFSVDKNGNVTSGLSGWLLIVIIAVCVLAAAGAAVFVFFFLKKRLRKKEGAAE